MVMLILATVGHVFGLQKTLQYTFIVIESKIFKIFVHIDDVYIYKLINVKPCMASYPDVHDGVVYRCNVLESQLWAS